MLDELLHSVIPLLVILFWKAFEVKSAVRFKQILLWLICPLVYLVFILVRGHFAHFYPYPFVDVDELGLSKVLVNSIGLVLVFVVLSFLFIGIGKIIAIVKS